MFDQLPALQRLLIRLMEGKIDVAQDPYQKMLFKQEGDKAQSFATITGPEWKEMLPKMYVWFDYMSMPQPNAAAVGAHGAGAHGLGAHGTGAHGFDFGPTLKRKVTVGAHGMGAHGTGAHGTGAHDRHAGTDLSIKLAMAVRSIPAYVEHA